MVDWMHSLSIVSLVLVICAGTALVTLAIHAIADRLAAAGHRDAGRRAGRRPTPLIQVQPRIAT